MPPLETLPGTSYCVQSSQEFISSMARFIGGETVLLRVEDGASDEPLYFFTDRKADFDYHLTLVSGMMEGVIKGAAYGESYEDYETYVGFGEHPLSDTKKATLASIEPLAIDEKCSRIGKLLSNLRGK